MPHIERHLAGHKGSYACLSDAASVDTAIVFVHGFWGGAASTWEQIASQMDVATPHRATAEARDFFFYDYKTRDDTVNGHAVEFLTFLRRVYPTLDPALLSPTGGRGWLGRGIKTLVRRLLRRPAVQAPALKRTGAISIFAFDPGGALHGWRHRPPCLAQRARLPLCGHVHGHVAQTVRAGACRVPTAKRGERGGRCCARRRPAVCVVCAQ